MGMYLKFRLGSGGRAKQKPSRGSRFAWCRGPVSVACLVGLGLLTACTYRGGIDLPLTQKVAWFSYLNGDDIREACVPGAPARYRLVYNGEYDRQVRTYEILGGLGAGPGGGNLTVRVQSGGGIDLTGLSLSDLGGLGGWKRAEAALSAGDMAALERALVESGAFGPAPDGLSLASEEFYWLFVGCRDGMVHFNAWRFPGDRFAALRFPNLLLGHDATGVPVNPPRDVGPIDRVQRGGVREDATPRFDLAVGQNGLRGLAPRF